MLNKVCLLVNYNLYESKRYFTRKLAEAMNRKGIETRIIDVNETTLSGDTMASLKRYAPDLTCSFNSILPVSETKFLWDFLEIPHWAILVDPALYSIQLTRSPYTILSCVDRSDLAAVQANKFLNAFFWPHAVEKELSPGNQKRIYDVVFLGSCYDYESLRASWRQRNPESINKVLDDAIDLVYSDNRTSLSEALASAWNAAKLDIAGVDFAALFYYLDNYTRGKDRVELIRSIKDAHVHVFGDLAKDNAVGVLGWEQYLAGLPNVTVHPSVPFWDSLHLMQQSKICLNSMPFFKNGTHERVLAGLACGAVPVTTDNIYFREFFRDNEDLLYYSMKDKSSVNDRVNDLLAQESKRAKIADSGRKIVMENYTWDVRVNDLLEILPSLFSGVQARLAFHRPPSS
jgi:spore maturation protein CgeB